MKCCDNCKFKIEIKSIFGDFSQCTLYKILKDRSVCDNYVPDYYSCGSCALRVERFSTDGNIDIKCGKDLSLKFSSDWCKDYCDDGM